MATPLDAIIIGAGPSGIAMAHSLKHKLGFNDFMVSDMEIRLKMPSDKAGN